MELTGLKISWEVSPLNANVPQGKKIDFFLVAARWSIVNPPCVLLGAVECISSSNGDLLSNQYSFIDKYAYKKVGKLEYKVVGVTYDGTIIDSDSATYNVRGQSVEPHYLSMTSVTFVREYTNFPFTLFDLMRETEPYPSGT